MSRYSLIINKNDENMSWDFIPDSLWKTILRDFVSKNVDGVGFGGITSQADIQKIAGFEVDLPFKCKVHTTFYNKTNQKLEQSFELTVVAYTSKLSDRIESVPFNQWDAVNEEYPVDHLFFFSGTTLILEAIPYESTIVFHLDEAQHNQLIKLDPLMENNLYPEPEVVSTVTVTG